MSPSSNRYVSLALAVLVAGCQGAPRAQPSAPHADSAAPAATPASVDGATNPPPAVPGANGGAVSGESARAAAGSGGATPLVATPVASNPGAVRIAPASPPAPIPPEAAQHFADAVKLMKDGRQTDAELEFKRLAVAYPTLSGPELNLGLLYLQASRLSEAETAFKAALDRNPDNAVAGNELGIVERRLGKFAASEAAYQRAIASEPTYAPAYLNLGVLYDLYLGEPQKALDQFERYQQIAGESKQVSGWVIELRKRVAAANPAPKKEPS